MTTNIQNRRAYLKHRLLILVAYETNNLAELRPLAEASAVYGSVHMLIFNPSRSLRAHEYDGHLYLQRVRGSSTWVIGALAAYYTIQKRLSARKQLFGMWLPLPQEATGLWRWLWKQWIGKILYNRCKSLSIAPYAIVATDPITLSVAIRLKKLYNCPIILLKREKSLNTFDAPYHQLSPDDLVSYVSNAVVNVTEMIP